MPAAARDRGATEARILSAVGEVLVRDGFAGVGINAIAKQAGVDKVLIYRYFGGLPELLRAWGASGRFWPRVSDLLGDDPAAFLALPLAERVARFLEHFADSLRQRPLTQALLVAELSERNELTAILEAEREAWGEEAARVLGGSAAEAAPLPESEAAKELGPGQEELQTQVPAQVQPVMLVLLAGIQYLVLRARRIRIFGGVDIRSDAGWTEIQAALRHLCTVLLADAGGVEAKAGVRGQPGATAIPLKAPPAA